MYWVTALHCLLTAINGSAFLVLATVHFAYINEDYWTENFRDTARLYTLPLLLECITAWFNLHSTLWVTSVVMLVIGLFLCCSCWYYQIQLADQSSIGDQQMLLHMSRIRAFVWIIRIILIYMYMIM